VVGDSPSRDGWKTLEYDGIRVDVPSDWERVDTGGCEFHLEQWAPPDSAPCGVDQGVQERVAFYASATFDPARGPGVRRTTENGSAGWGGYTLTGDVAVYVTSADRGVVRDVLASARAMSKKTAL
jgi:hypothetical protein